VATNRHCSYGQADRQISLLNLVVCVLVSSVVAGCARHEVSQPPAVEKLVCSCPQDKTASVASDEEDTEITDGSKYGSNFDGCTDINDLRAHIQYTQELIAGTRNSVLELNSAAPPALSSASTRNGPSKDSDAASTRAWWRRIRSWNNHNCALTKGCELLYSAHGEMIHPEFLLALKNLDGAGDWLEKSMGPTASGNPKLALAYVRAAEMAASRASKVLEGRIKANPRTAVIKPPGFLKKLIKTT
jgi:hypothetical protein